MKEKFYPRLLPGERFGNEKAWCIVEAHIAGKQSSRMDKIISLKMPEAEARRIAKQNSAAFMERPHA